MAQSKKRITRSPRAPSFPLDEAIEKAMRVYEGERLHAAPLDAVAQSLGYSGANNGAALKTIASLRYYGLIERDGAGQARVSKEVEAYNFAPGDDVRRELRIKWLKAPPVFSDLLEKFPGELPSDSTIKYTLIQRGFSPSAADECLAAFRRSVEFANYYGDQVGAEDFVVSDDGGDESEFRGQTASGGPAREAVSADSRVTSKLRAEPPSMETDRIPVRLGGGRRAWIEIPSPFFSADKDRLKAQIDLLLADDEVHEEDEPA